ncbi:MAG: hypothetical protein CME70_14535 [Halobacteriovorax sp.]|nr:hypothetical protein [Halobacteriovorax sp.]|tara:strand:+ start:230945 stop:231835 length:891 start_codon:yes stop_codon:yes gene_type:complete
MQKPVLFSLLMTILILSSATAKAEKKAAIIQGYDYIVAPGEIFNLEVKVERAKFFPLRADLKKEMVHYYNGDYHLGTSLTNRDGLSKLETVFYTPGLYIIKAELSKNSKYRSNKTDNRVLVVDPSVPLLVSDIDHTLADISGREFLRTPDQKIPTLANASEVLNRLSKEFKIFYMTARDDLFIKRTKNWLDIKKFPVGPSFFWDFGFFNNIPRNHGEYKAAQIKRLAKKFKNILIGVGDKPHDVAAYRENGLRAYYIGDTREELVPGVISLKTWTEIENHLKTHPIGTLEGDPLIK